MSSGPDEALAAHELDLVTRASKGDAAAFDRFYERNAPSVQLLVERLLGPGEAADAVVVEAFEKTVRRLPLLGARNSSPSLYVLSTARNGAYAALGRGRPTAEGGPLAALLALPSRQRELLALRELGLPEAACAEVAGIDPSDVGPQVARARLRLTDELEGLSLSSVFADGRAERLLAAEVVRVEGQAVPGALADEISSHADEDSRFAAALSAVRSPSRSIGQLPSVSGPSRLAATARAQAVAGSVGGAVASSAAAAAPIAPVAAPPTPPARPRPKSDPYDDEIGDEIAWGIVDDEEGGFGETPPAPDGPQVADPADGQWADGAGAVSVSEEPTEFRPAVPASGAIPPPVPQDPEAPGDPLADPFAGWDDALDWDEEEKAWTAGPGAAPVEPAAAQTPDLVKHDEPTAVAPAADNDVAAGTPIASRPPAVSLEETRAFDAVAAGLVDPDPIPISDFDHGEEPPGEGRSRWRWLGWTIALLLLFAGFAFAAYAWQSANQDPDLPPASRIDETSPGGTSSAATPKATPKRTPKATPKPSSTSSSSSSGGSGGSASSGSTGASGAGSSGSSAASGGSRSSGGSGGNSSSSGSGSGSAKTNDSQVTSGESSSGGAVRGAGESGGASGGTTP